MDIFTLPLRGLGKHLTLATSTSVNNCYIYMYIYHIFDVPIVTTRIVYAFYYTYSNMQLTN